MADPAGGALTGSGAAVSEPRIGRVLVASLHQGIADILPERLEFYEHWLSTTGLREGTISMGSLAAVLSFLRIEGRDETPHLGLGARLPVEGVYNLTTTRAGECAADWAVAGMSRLERGFIRALPGPLRRRRALRVAGRLVRATYPGSRATVRTRRGQLSVELRGSLFCEVRQMTMTPLCGFYAAAIERVLEHLAVRSDVHVYECRASGAAKRCVMAVVQANSTAPVQGARA